VANHLTLGDAGSVSTDVDVAASVHAIRRAVRDAIGRAGTLPKPLADLFSSMYAELSADTERAAEAVRVLGDNDWYIEDAIRAVRLTAARIVGDRYWLDPTDPVVWPGSRLFTAADTYLARHEMLLSVLSSMARANRAAELTGRAVATVTAVADGDSTTDTILAALRRHHQHTIEENSRWGARRDEEERRLEDMAAELLGYVARLAEPAGPRSG
jgi:hypothetical protein